MKKQKPLTLTQYYKMGIVIKFEVYHIKSGLNVIRQCTQVPGFHTPHLDIDAFTFRLHRKGLQRIGFIKTGICIELYYHPQKIAVA